MNHPTFRPTSNFILLLAFCFLALSSTSQAKDSSSTFVCDSTQLTGAWNGKYQQGSREFGFSLDLTSDGQKITGTSIEPDPNNPSTHSLTASWTGAVNGSTLTLLKKYADNGSSITYTAICNGNYESISGSWKISFLNKGDFTLNKRRVEKTDSDQSNVSLPSTPPAIGLSDLSFKDATPISE